MIFVIDNNQNQLVVISKIVKFVAQCLHIVYNIKNIKFKLCLIK